MKNLQNEKNGVVEGRKGRRKEKERMKKKFGRREGRWGS
jgi:hypothetical protein